MKAEQAQDWFGINKMTNTSRYIVEIRKPNRRSRSRVERFKILQENAMSHRNAILSRFQQGDVSEPIRISTTGTNTLIVDTTSNGANLISQIDGVVRVVPDFPIGSPD